MLSTQKVYINQISNNYSNYKQDLEQFIKDFKKKINITHPPSLGDKYNEFYDRFKVLFSNLIKIKLKNLTILNGLKTILGDNYIPFLHLCAFFSCDEIYDELNKKNEITIKELTSSSELINEQSKDLLYYACFSGSTTSVEKALNLHFKLDFFNNHKNPNYFSQKKYENSFYHPFIFILENILQKAAETNSHCKYKEEDLKTLISKFPFLLSFKYNGSRNTFLHKIIRKNGAKVYEIISEYFDENIIFANMAKSKPLSIAVNLALCYMKSPINYKSLEYILKSNAPAKILAIKDKIKKAIEFNYYSKRNYLYPNYNNQDASKETKTLGKDIYDLNITILSGSIVDPNNYQNLFELLQDAINETIKLITSKRINNLTIDYANEISKLIENNKEFLELFLVSSKENNKNYFERTEELRRLNHQLQTQITKTNQNISLNEMLKDFIKNKLIFHEESNAYFKLNLMLDKNYGNYGIENKVFFMYCKNFELFIYTIPNYYTYNGHIVQYNNNNNNREEKLINLADTKNKEYLLKHLDFDKFTFFHQTIPLTLKIDSNKLLKFVPIKNFSISFEISPPKIIDDRYWQYVQEVNSRILGDLVNSSTNLSSSTPNSPLNLNLELEYDKNGKYTFQAPLEQSTPSENSYLDSYMRKKIQQSTTESFRQEHNNSNNTNQPFRGNLTWDPVKRAFNYRNK